MLFFKKRCCFCGQLILGNTVFCFCCLSCRVFNILMRIVTVQSIKACVCMYMCMRVHKCTHAHALGIQDKAFLTLIWPVTILQYKRCWDVWALMPFMYLTVIHGFDLSPAQPDDSKTCQSFQFTCVQRQKSGGNV